MHKKRNLTSFALMAMLFCTELVFVLFSSSIANAAITANGTFTSTQASNATSLTWSHTVAAGTNRVLFVELAIDGLGASVTGVTYSGIALTQVGRGTGNHAIEIWRLINPTVGAPQTWWQASAPPPQLLAALQPSME
jgi:outer membrane lipoprotein SlyB